MADSKATPNRAASTVRDRNPRRDLGRTGKRTLPTNRQSTDDADLERDMKEGGGQGQAGPHR